MTLRITHFMRKPRPNVFSIERLYQDVRAGLPSDICAREWTCKEFSKGLLPRVRDMWRARMQQGDINHVTGDVHYLTFFLDPRRTILTVHDLVLLERFRGARRWLIWFFWYWLPIKRSRMIIAISNATRDALLESVACDPDKIQVIHNPVSREFTRSPYSFNAALPRILQVGTGPNKNLERVAAALEGAVCELIVIGPLSESQREVLERHGIHYTNHVGLSREELIEQYRKCDVVVFASTYEGFGLPIIEAQATGRPVVTSNIGPMPEVAGLGACLVDPYEISSIRSAIERICRDPDFRERLANSGYENSFRFNLNSVSKQYADLYKLLRD